MEKMTLKKTVEALGYTVEKYTRGYNYRSIFATDTDGKLWYFHIEDLRDSEPRVLRRTAESLMDYTGGTNRYDVREMAEKIGVQIVEPRRKCDYNSM